MDRTNEKIVLYDGVCNLCDAAIRFILPRDSRARLRFASLQSELARSALARHSISAERALESIVFIEDGELYLRSTAALRIARHLDFPWNLGAGLLVIPRPIRDFVYDWVARNRYRWFGKQKACLLPRPEWKSRFLDWPAG